MEIPRLKIGKFVFKIPIVLGAMGVHISSWPLPPAVFKEGCLPTITSLASCNLKVSHSEFIRISREALEEEIKRCRPETNQPLAVNFVGALSNAVDLIKTAVKNDIKIIVYGAVIPKNLPDVVPDPSVNLIPIISSSRLAGFILKLWQKRYRRTPDAFIVEGPLAGGHLGFNQDQLDQPEKFSLENILRDVLKVVRPYEQKIGQKIPVIAAGGIYTGADIARMLSIGAAGVQLGTRFVATHECPAAPEFKQAYLAAKKSDVTIIHSPIGLLGRAVHNRFLEKVAAGEIHMRCPYKCIKHCYIERAGFCILQALLNAKNGELEEGLIFAGSNVHRVDRIMSVKELIAELVEGIKNSPLTLPVPI